ncbi:MAG: hypothetical protein SVT56_13470, partial [Chloroflexota bacterium]|nr:hypothetical protein [Chloroflexota bacterium]
VYQGATSLLGVILGPVGWAITGFSLAGGPVVAVRGWLRGKREQKLVLVVITLLFTIGDSPFEFFGVKEDGSFTDVKKSYRAVMKSLHPDKLEPDLPQWLQDDFYEKLLRCQEAYKQTEKIFEQT